MVDWSASMQQTYEYYLVDPKTWRDTKQLLTVKNGSIDHDDEASTLGSASISLTESVGECYVRAYLVTIQNGVKERHPLATVLVQTPSSTYDGKNQEVTVDAYTSLLELKERIPPLGYSVLKGENIMDVVYRITRENVRAPVVKPSCDIKLQTDFVANSDDNWLTFLTDLMAKAKYGFALDELGRILFAPQQEIASLQPVWTYNDDNSSILYPNISMRHDLYGIPNVVEVIYSDSRYSCHAKAVNDDPNSPTSTVNRGREIPYRITDPALDGNPTDTQIKEYAELMLKQLSSVEYSVTYTHGYCPVRIGDCVRLNYEKSGLSNIKAKVIRQTINCVPGCKVTETAVFTKKLWR
jgi:hypothetical protein